MVYLNKAISSLECIEVYEEELVESNKMFTAYIWIQL